MKEFTWRFLLLFWMVPLWGQSINYQGRLTDAGGEPVNDTVNISLKIYDSETGGSVLYSEDVGEVDVVNGLYSFNFGERGKSLVELSEIIAVTTNSEKVYNFDTKYKPLVGEVVITDGSKSWSNVTGSSDGNLLIGSVNAGLGNVSGIYTIESPASDLLLKVTYFCEFGGISRTLTNLSSKYLELAIGNVTLQKREPFAAVPFAQTAGSVVNMFKSIESFEYDAQSVYVAEKDLIIFGTVSLSGNVGGNTYSLGGHLTIEIYADSGELKRQRRFDVSASKGGNSSNKATVFFPISTGEIYTIKEERSDSDLSAVYF